MPNPAADKESKQTPAAERSGNSIDPEKEKDRSTTLRVAMLSIIVSGIVTVSVTLITTHSQDAQSQEAFLRSQRQAQYAKYLTDADVLHADLSALSSPGNETPKTKIEADLAAVNADFGQIQVLAGDAVTTGAKAVTIGLRRDVYETYTNVCSASVCLGTPYYKDSAPAGTEDNRMYQSYVDVRQTLVKAIRAELGVNQGNK